MRKLTLVLMLCLLALPLGATEPNPSKRQRVLVEKLLELMSMDETVRSAIDTIFAQIQAQFAQSTEAEEEAKELFESFRARSAKVDFKSLLEEGFIRIYAKYFTEQELEDLIAFYSTPTGRKSIEVMSDLMREGMQLGGEQLGPKIEEIMAEVTAEFEKKRPWRRTMMDLRTIAVALEAYAIDNETYPEGDFDTLKPLLEPVYVRSLPETDVWGHKYAYIVSPDRTRYRLVSAGSDSIFEWDSRRIGEAIGETTDTRYAERLQDDVIFADGMFLQAPVQSKSDEAHDW